MFDRMFMKPGKPTTFGVGEKNGRKIIFFAFPGNPVSAGVCARLLLEPALQVLRGRVSGGGPSGGLAGVRVRGKLLKGVVLDKIRPEYHRVIVRYGRKGFEAVSTGVQRSSRICSMVDEGGETSNGLALLPSAEEKGRGRMEDGEEVVILLTGKVLEGLEAGGGRMLLLLWWGRRRGEGRGGGWRKGLRRSLAEIRRS